MGDTYLEIAKTFSCLCSCVHGLKPMHAAFTDAYAACTDVYAALFLRFYVHGDRLAYAGSYLRMWALTCVREMFGRGLTLPIFLSLSTLPFL